jgi:hypothetical protein
MKRNLIAIAAAGLALGANAVFATNNWAFDDAYWKQAPSVQSTQSAQVTPSAPAKGDYDFVNQYNY